MTEYDKAITRRLKAMEYKERERKRRDARHKFGLWAVYRVI